MTFRDYEFLIVSTGESRWLRREAAWQRSIYLAAHCRLGLGLGTTWHMLQMFLEAVSPISTYREWRYQHYPTGLLMNDICALTMLDA